MRLETQGMTKDVTQSNWRKKHETAVVLHLFYPELFDEITEYLKNLGEDYDLYVTIPEENVELAEQVRKYYPDAYILVHPNLGRDILPFLNILKSILPLNYKLLLKLHSKKTLHRADGMSWRQDVFEKLLGSTDLVKNVKAAFLADPNLGMLGPLGHVINTHLYMGHNKEKVQDLLLRTGFQSSLPESSSFVASTMFWCRPEIFQPLLKANITSDDFEPEPLPEDGSTAHAMERFFGILTTLQGYRLKEVDVRGSVSNHDPYRVYSYAPIPAYLRLRQIKSVVFYRTYDKAYAIEYLRITAPFRQAGIEVIQGNVADSLDLEKIKQGDAVIIQREFPCNSVIYDEIVKVAREAGKVIIYEIDDLLFDLPEDHPERKSEAYTKALLPMLSALVEADLVVVPTEKLRETLKGFNPNIIILPNYLDDSIWHLEPPVTKDQDIITVGYMGSNSHTPDLDMISSALITLAKKYKGKLKFKIWGTPLPESLKDLPGVDWQPSPTNVYVDFVEYFQTQMADIFIAPLSDNLFNNCKSPIKFLEYSARGVPGVYSAVEPYRLIIADGKDGLLATNQEEWIQSLERLIENAPLRMRMAKAAQKKIREHWLLSHNIPNWPSVLETLPAHKYQDMALRPLSIHLMNTVRRQVSQSQKNIEKTVSEHERQIEQKQREFESYSLKREEEFSARFRELETAHQNDIEKTVSEYEGQIELINEQLYYWSDQTHKKIAEIDQLNNKLNNYEQTLNEIYQSRSWKVISSYQKNIGKIAAVSKKVINIKTPIERMIPGRFAKKKQAIIDSGLFDPDYYFSKNPDVKNAGVDPFVHFLNFGGSEGRDPSPEFDSSWYLDNNADVKAAGMNPLLHYILFGKEEGRSSQAVTNEEDTTDLATSGVTKIISVQKSIPETIILAPKIVEILEKDLRENFVLSLSHDDYLTITGGAQVYITDEQRLVNQKDQSYLHVYPYNKENALVSSDTILYLGVNLDGRQLLETESNELVNALSDLADTKHLINLSIHHSMGFNRSTLQYFLNLAGGKAVFWLHDYFSLCPSYNLMRNDREYCGAPDINSNSCRLCSYGDQRREQNKEFEQLFRENQLEVAAPSQFTFELWQSRFPIISTAHIIPPAVLEWRTSNPSKFVEGQMRVAFLGYPLDYKGWKTWLRLVQEFNDEDMYKFFHFSSQEGEFGNYKRIDTRVTKENRLAMVDSLRRNDIDVAFLWSTVAETFSFTLHEALAAGCFIVTNPNSGNIQNYICRNPKRGIILKDEKELIDYFHTDGLVTKVIDYQKLGKPQAELIFGSLEEIN